MARSDRKKVIVWTKGLDYFLLDSPSFNGGIAVQLTFWAKAFLNHGWTVYSFSKEEARNIDGINFTFYQDRKGLSAFLFDCFSPLIVFVRTRPNLVVFRGASRNLFFVSFWARLLGIKLVFMGAHDTDFNPGNEIINYISDRLLYRAGLRLVKMVVVQNQVQKDLLLDFYKRSDSILIPNIWGETKPGHLKPKMQNGYFLWVANFRDRKRPEHFVDLARQFPEHQFVMIGSNASSNSYNSCKKAAKSIDNLEFLGGLPFQQTHSYFKDAHVFICTSESEGFPNTFLQAWSNNVPVITTFDPGGIVSDNALGIVVDTMDELVSAVHRLLNDENLYSSITNNIQEYFRSEHDVNRAFAQLTEYASK